MIQTLTHFTVTTEFGRNETVFTVYGKGQSAPAAVLRKDGAYDRLRPFQVFTGPGLTELAGYVQPFRAWSADRAPIGKVAKKSGIIFSDKWEFTQDGLGTLEGRPVGLTRLRQNMFLDIKGADLVLPTRLRFRSPDSTGFELTRPAGPKERYRVTVHDARVDRLLILACVVHTIWFDHGFDLRKDWVDLTANPFKVR